MREALVAFFFWFPIPDAKTPWHPTRFRGPLVDFQLFIFFFRFGRAGMPAGGDHGRTAVGADGRAAQLGHGLRPVAVAPHRTGHAHQPARQGALGLG